MVDEDKTDVLFLQLVASFQASAMMQLGKLSNPVSGKIERDLDQARHTIDMLMMLQEKTKGNLSGTEEEMMDKFIFELQMNYANEIKADEGGTAGDDTGVGGEGASEGGAGGKETAAG